MNNERSALGIWGHVGAISNRGLRADMSALRNEHVRGSVKVTSVAKQKKITEKGWSHNGYEKRQIGHMLRRMADAPVPGNRRRGRQ